MLAGSMVVIQAAMMCAANEITVNQEGEMVLNVGSTFKVQCPGVTANTSLACVGSSVEIRNGLCTPKLAPCSGDQVEVTAAGNCVPTTAPCTGDLVEVNSAGDCVPKQDVVTKGWVNGAIDGFVTADWVNTAMEVCRHSTPLDT
jgi:hypothetical protein